MEGYIGNIGSKVTAEVKTVNIFEYQDYKFSYYGASRYIYTIENARKRLLKDYPESENWECTHIYTHRTR